MGTISIFYFALLTRRAFTLCTSVAHQLPVEAIYESVHINWTASSEHTTLVSRLPGSATELGKQNAVGSGYQHWRLINPDRDEYARTTFDTFSHGNLSQLGADKQIVLFTLNRGASVRLFDNPFHEQQLRNMGLSPETAFGCAVDFLFAPVPKILNMIRPSVEYLKNYLTIGIHVRTGDHTFHTADIAKVKDAKRFFMCAHRIETDIIAESKAKGKQNEVLWVLISDSMNLRRQAQTMYKEKIYTVSDTPIEHTMSEFNLGKRPNATLSGFLTAASEHWLFGLLDIHVVDYHSGFGRSGAMRTFQDGKMFMINPKDEQTLYDCHRDQHVSIRQVGHHHAGA